MAAFRNFPKFQQICSLGNGWGWGEEEEEEERQLILGRMPGDSWKVGRIDWLVGFVSAGVCHLFCWVFSFCCPIWFCFAQLLRLLFSFCPSVGFHRLALIPILNESSFQIIKSLHWVSVGLLFQRNGRGGGGGEGWKFLLKRKKRRIRFVVGQLFLANY